MWANTMSCSTWCVSSANGSNPARSRRSFSARNARWISVDDETFSCISDIGAPDSAAACTRAATDRPTWSDTLRTSSRRSSSDNSPNVGSDGSQYSSPSPRQVTAGPSTPAALDDTSLRDGLDRGRRRTTGRHPTLDPDQRNVATPTRLPTVAANSRPSQRRTRRATPDRPRPGRQAGTDRVLRQDAEQLAADRVDELLRVVRADPTTTRPTRRSEPRQPVHHLRRPVDPSHRRPRRRGRLTDEQQHQRRRRQPRRQRPSRPARSRRP